MPSRAATITRQSQVEISFSFAHNIHTLRQLELSRLEKNTWDASQGVGHNTQQTANHKHYIQKLPSICKLVW